MQVLHLRQRPEPSILSLAYSSEKGKEVRKNTQLGICLKTKSFRQSNVCKPTSMFRNYHFKQELLALCVSHLKLMSNPFSAFASVLTCHTKTAIFTSQKSEIKEHCLTKLTITCESFSRHTNGTLQLYQFFSVLLSATSKTTGHFNLRHTCIFTVFKIYSDSKVKTKRDELHLFPSSCMES